MRSKSNEVTVNLKSSFKSQLIKCQSIMDTSKFESVVLKGMGKATNRAVNLALELNSNNFNSFSVTPITYSVPIKEFPPIPIGQDKDTFDPEEHNNHNNYNIKHIPAIRIEVRKSDLELSKQIQC